MSALPKDAIKLLSGEYVSATAKSWPRHWDIGNQMTLDVAERLDVALPFIPYAQQVKERYVGHPEDTDAGQCWSEEFFSLLVEEIAS